MTFSKAQGEVRAVTLASNPALPSHAGEHPLGEAAALIASGSGLLGTDRKYIEQLAAQLERLVIEGAYVDQAANLVGLLTDA